LWSLITDKDHNGSYTINGHKIQSITLGFDHGVMVTMKGVVLGFGYNRNYQLGVVDPSDLSDETVSMPIEGFAKVTKFKGATRLLDVKEPQQPGTH
jgi:alpha-tubulin suppressor-like RCC1 family protein